jgi:5-methylcytosine-specific restriction endonuclease McrA
MRYINNTDLAARLPLGWTSDAETALKAVRSATDDDRASTVNSNGDVWRTIKPILQDLSHGKCWTCEARESRSDGVVDHYRPKNRVAESPSHPGYWWLAFNWRNFRFLCTFCNSRRVAELTAGGKSDSFALVQEDNRALPEDGVEDEEPLALDATVASDCLLLSFLQDGTVGVAELYLGTAQEARAAHSIGLYHLDEQKLVDLRRDLFHTVHRTVELGKVFHSRWASGDAVSKKAFDTAVATLEQMVHPAAEFSSAAREMVRGLRHGDHPWIESIC